MFSVFPILDICFDGQHAAHTKTYCHEREAAENTFVLINQIEPFNENVECTAANSAR